MDAIEQLKDDLRQGRLDGDRLVDLIVSSQRKLQDAQQFIEEQAKRIEEQAKRIAELEKQLDNPTPRDVIAISHQTLLTILMVRRDNMLLMRWARFPPKVLRGHAIPI